VLDIQVGTAIFQLIAFLILYWFLKKYAFGPLMKMMNDRQQYIENQILAAEKGREEAERLAEEHRQMLQAARKEAHELIENARRTGDKQAQEIIAAAEAEAKRLHAEAVAEIRREKEKALAELRDQVAELSVLLASKIIARELDNKDHQALLEEAVKEMGQQLC
jgi:F-type H+-transporting ATPase subunit b